MISARDHSLVAEFDHPHYPLCMSQPNVFPAAAASGTGQDTKPKIDGTRYLNISQKTTREQNAGSLLAFVPILEYWDILSTLILVLIA